MRCPYRKKKVEEKKKKIEEENDLRMHKSYANVVKTVIEKTEIPKQNITIGNEHGIKATFCLMYAHLQNIAQPGTFNHHLQEILAINEMPKINIPQGEKYSEKIFGMNLKNPKETTLTTPAPENQKVPIETEEIELTEEYYEEEEFEMDTTPTQLQIDTDDENEENENKRKLYSPEEITQIKKSRISNILTLDDLPVKLYATEELNYNSAKDIIDGISDGKIKYIITDPRLTTEKFESDLLTSRVQFNPSKIQILTDEEFKKIKTSTKSESYQQIKPRDTSKKSGKKSAK